MLVPQLIFGTALGTWYAAGERQRLEAGAALLAGNIRARLDQQLEAMTAAVQALATSPNIDTRDFAALQAQAADALRFRGSAIAMRDAEHQQWINTIVPFGTPLPVSRHPVVIAADREVFANGRPVVSDLYIGAVAGTPFVLVNVPVERGGRVVYALNMAIRPAAIRDAMFASNIPEGWLVSVIDGQNVTVARTRGHDTFVGRPAPPSFVERASGRRGIVHNVTSLDGEAVLAAFESSTISDWRVAVSVPQSWVSAPIRTLALTMTAFAAVAVLISALLAMLYSRRITADVRALQDMASKVGIDTLPAARRHAVRELAGVAEALAAADAQLKARDAQANALLRELDHRVRNALSVVLSLVSHTLREGHAPEVLAQRVSGRIMAIARAHDLLSHASWNPILLRDLVTSAASDEERSIEYDGPDVRLRPEAVVPLSQVLHEMAAVAAPNDRTRLVVRADGDRIAMTWDGGAVGRSGLHGIGRSGATLVRLCLERQLFGTIDSEAPLSASMPVSMLCVEPPAPSSDQRLSAIRAA